MVVANSSMQRDWKNARTNKVENKEFRIAV